MKYISLDKIKILNEILFYQEKYIYLDKVKIFKEIYFS